jgi:hypothetical protein
VFGLATDGLAVYAAGRVTDVSFVWDGTTGRWVHSSDEGTVVRAYDLLTGAVLWEDRFDVAPAGTSGTGVAYKGRAARGHVFVTGSVGRTATTRPRAGTRASTSPWTAAACSSSARRRAARAARTS